jgi:hypothetical protein
MPWSTSIASASRVKASITIDARRRRSSNSQSETKSIDHIPFAAKAAGCRSRLAPRIAAGVEVDHDAVSVHSSAP